MIADSEYMNFVLPDNIDEFTVPPLLESTSSPTSSSSTPTVSLGGGGASSISRQVLWYSECMRVEWLNGIFCCLCRFVQEAVILITADRFVINVADHQGQKFVNKMCWTKHMFSKWHVAFNADNVDSWQCPKLLKFGSPLNPSQCSPTLAIGVNVAEIRNALPKKTSSASCVRFIYDASNPNIFILETVSDQLTSVAKFAILNLSASDIHVDALQFDLCCEMPSKSLNEAVTAANRHNKATKLIGIRLTPSELVISSKEGKNVLEKRFVSTCNCATTTTTTTDATPQPNPDDADADDADINEEQEQEETQGVEGKGEGVVQELKFCVPSDLLTAFTRAYTLNPRIAIMANKDLVAFKYSFEQYCVGSDVHGWYDMRIQKAISYDTSSSSSSLQLPQPFQYPTMTHHNPTTLVIEDEHLNSGRKRQKRNTKSTKSSSSAARNRSSSSNNVQKQQRLQARKQKQQQQQMMTMLYDNHHNQNRNGNDDDPFAPISNCPCVRLANKCIAEHMNTYCNDDGDTSATMQIPFVTECVPEIHESLFAARPAVKRALMQECGYWCMLLVNNNSNTMNNNNMTTTTTNYDEEEEEDQEEQEDQEEEEQEEQVQEEEQEDEMEQEDEVEQEEEEEEDEDEEVEQEEDEEPTEKEVAE
jgi:hypothetical protein